MVDGEVSGGDAEVVGATPVAPDYFALHLQREGVLGTARGTDDEWAHRFHDTHFCETLIDGIRSYGLSRI